MLVTQWLDWGHPWVDEIWRCPCYHCWEYVWSHDQTALLMNVTSLNIKHCYNVHTLLWAPQDGCIRAYYRGVLTMLAERWLATSVLNRGRT